MSEALVREIAEQIFNQQILKNWIFYGLLTAIGMLTAVGTNFLSAYIQKRANTFATKADLAELLLQLRATTEVAEKVKAAILHADWESREWKTLRRLKLEELVVSIYSIQDWISAEINARIYGEKRDNGPSPLSKVQLLTLLYFPEFGDDVHALLSEQTSMIVWIGEIQRKLLKAGNDINERQIALDLMLNELAGRWNAFFRPFTALELRARKLITEIVGPP